MKYLQCQLELGSENFPAFAMDFSSTDYPGTLSDYTKGVLNHFCIITWTNKNKLRSVLTGSYPATYLVPPRLLA